jgi:hypothetical protein
MRPGPTSGRGSSERTPAHSVSIVADGRVYVAVCPAGGERTFVGLCVGSP